MPQSTMMALLVVLGVWGCASSESSLKVQVHDDGKGPVRYEGPLAGPHDDIDDLVEAACERMVEETLSSRGSSRLGYCALFFNSEADDEKWFISHIAPMEGNSDAVERACAMPMDPVESHEKVVLELGGHHAGHGANVKQVWRPTMFFNGKTGKTWDRDTLVFSLENSGVCTVYSLIGFSRVVAVRRDGEFVATGTIYNDQGIIQDLKGED